MEGVTLQSGRSVPATPNRVLSTGALADLAACSAQHVRNLEREGAIPPSSRAANGYRRFDDRHLHAVLAYGALSAALGPFHAKSLMRELLTDETGVLGPRLDALHARLHAERQSLNRAIAATELIAAERLDAQHRGDAMSISELAGALDVRTSTLRHWETEGLLAPEWHGRARSYSPSDVQQARIVDQLRRAGYRIAALRPVLTELRAARGQPQISRALEDRLRQLDARSHALLVAGVHLYRMGRPARG